MLYRPGNREGEIATEVGVQVTATSQAPSAVVPSTLPATEAATTVHTGPPADLGATHDAVRDWCAVHGRDVTGVRWEIYGDPDQSGHFDVAVHRQLAASTTRAPK
jgi:effector-binding domain-containing protein